jgi:hexosaminidase
VVYSRSIHTYLDLPRIILADAYNLSPVPRNITPQQLSHIIGVGCQMWGECTPRVVDVYQNTFPRIAAYSEVGWTKEENKDFARFSSALDMLKRYWDMKGIYFQKE